MSSSSRLLERERGVDPDHQNPPGLFRQSGKKPLHIIAVTKIIAWRQHRRNACGQPVPQGVVHASPGDRGLGRSADEAVANTNRALRLDGDRRQTQCGRSAPIDTSNLGLSLISVQE